MACRYTYQGKTYEAHEFDDVLRAMAPDVASKYMPGVASVPPAPFVTDTKAWTALALKRMIAYAVENGFDSIAWTNGEQQAARYDLSKQVRAVTWNGGDRKIVTITPHEGNDIEFNVGKDGVISGFGAHTGNEYQGRKIDDVVGKDLADRIMTERYGELTGIDLKIGGEGMKGFYDGIVPQVANDVLKKIGGGKVGVVEVGSAEGIDASMLSQYATEQPSFEITDAMRDAAMAGLPLFSRAVREEGIPPGASNVLTSAKYESELYKGNPDFNAAKSGDAAAALRFVRAQVARSTIAYAKRTFGPGAIYVAPHAEELTGRNRIPITLAEFYAHEADGIADDKIVQTVRAHHTNATMMDRLLSRPEFTGEVKPGQKYVIVDDVVTGGGTVAELADYIRWRGGIVRGVVTLADASKTVTMRPRNDTIESIKRKFGDAIRRIFRIKPEALTNQEAEYLNGFASLDALRDRVAAAGQGGRARLAGEGAGAPGSQDQRPLASHGNYMDEEAASFLRNNRPAAPDVARRAVSSPDRWYRPILTAITGVLRGSSTFGALDRSIHTQLHKAQKNPYFGAVFTRLQHFMQDSSRAALRPAELAPTVLPRIDVAQSVKPAFAAMLKGKEAAADIDAAFMAVLRGTLADEVYADKEGAGLTEEQFRVYREFRDAIDASLDELSSSEAWRIARPIFLDDRGRLTGPGLRMKKQMLDNPGEASDALLSLVSAQLEAAELRARELVAVAREKAPFIEATGNDRDDLWKALRSDVGNVYQNDAINAALKAMDQVDAWRDTMERISKVFARAQQLKKNGYAPLMRFGQHYLTVTRMDQTTGAPMEDEAGETVVEYFSLFDSAAERDKALREMRELYSDDETVEFDVGTVSEESWKRFKGISPETLALFANKFDLEKDDVWQQYYRSAASSRSTLARLIHRKGTPGFSEDGARVLAAFLTSNGRRASTLYHEGDIQEAIDGFPRQMGAEQDEALRLVEYVTDGAGEEAAAPRALMFMHFLGGTVSNFLINATQPAMVTLPYLAKSVGMARAMALLKDAYAIRRNPDEMENELRAALERAEQEGKVGAQEIYHLWQETARPLISKLGRFGDAVTYRAHAFMQLWGLPFAVAEHMNRQVTFISAYNAAKETGKTPEQAYSLAIRAVDETQFIYSKQNRPNWARGTWGSLIFTFRLFSISYTELIVRLLREGPAGRKAALYMLGMLFLAAGTQGMPGADDLDDGIDTIAQMLGYNTSMKMSKRKWLEQLAGHEVAQFTMHGISALSPLDVSGRMSLGNLIPATALLKPSNSKKEADLLEIMGPIGGLSMSYLNTADAVATGNWRRAATEWMPKAVKDFAQGGEMLVSGEALDAHGRKVVDVNPLEAAVKMTGFNPQAVAEIGRNARAVQQPISMAARQKGIITEKWARGIVDGKPEDVAAAKRDLQRWNETNPETPISVKLSAVALRANAMRASKHDRFIRAATKEMKDFAREGLE